MWRSVFGMLKPVLFNLPFQVSMASQSFTTQRRSISMSQTNITADGERQPLLNGVHLRQTSWPFWQLAPVTGTSLCGHATVMKYVCNFTTQSKSILISKVGSEILRNGLQTDWDMRTYRVHIVGHQMCRQQDHIYCRIRRHNSKLGFRRPKTREHNVHQDRRYLPMSCIRSKEHAPGEDTRLWSTN